MEAELLREMISDRDKRIEKIQRKMDEQKEREMQLQKELDQVQQRSFQQAEHHRHQQKDIIREYKIALEKLTSLQHDFEHQRKSLHSYLGKFRPDQATDPAFIMRMQAQLCKAMHSMGILEHQFELSQKHSDHIIKYHKDQIAKTTEERTQIELKLMNDLVIRDTERLKIEEKFTQQMDEINKECEALERQMEENRGSDDESDDDDEDNKDDEESEHEPEDEAEKQAKEELMKMLQTQKQEIETLEAEIEEKEEMIQEMEEQWQLIQEAENSAGELVNRETMSVSSSHSQQQHLNNSIVTSDESFQHDDDDEEEEEEEAPEISSQLRLQQSEVDVEDISAEALLARVHAKFSPSQEEKKESSLEESEEEDEMEDVSCDDIDEVEDD